MLEINCIFFKSNNLGQLNKGAWIRPILFVKIVYDTEAVLHHFNSKCISTRIIFTKSVFFKKKIFVCHAHKASSEQKKEK